MTEREIARRDPATVLPDEQPVVDQHREHLLDEQRVAAGGLGQPGRRLGREARAAEQVRDQLGRRLRVEGLEQERRGVQLAAAPVRSRVEELRPRGAHQHDRRVARPVHDVVHDVEERRLGPVDVLPERDSGRSAARSSRNRLIAHGVSSAEPTPSPTPRISPRRRAIDAACSSSATVSTRRATTSSGGSNAWTPSAVRTASATGQYVMPSPYGRQRPLTTLARPAHRRRGTPRPGATCPRPRPPAR